MRLWKYAVLLLFVWFCLLVPNQIHAAKDQIQLFLNGKELHAEVPPQIVNGNTIVPVRIIAENLGADVTWDNENRIVGVEQDNIRIELQIDKTVAWINGKGVQLEAAPTIIEGNTMLPVRFVSENLGVKVNWDDLTRSVFLYKPEKGGSRPVAGGGDGTPELDAESDPIAGKDAKPSATPKPTATPKPSATPKPTFTPKPSATPDLKPEPTDSPDENSRPTPPKGDDENPRTTPTPSSKPSTGKNEKPKPTPTPSSKPGVKPKPSPSATPTPSDKPIARIHKIEAEEDRIVIYADNPLETNTFYLTDPERLVIDLPYSEFGKTLNGKKPVQNGEIPSSHPAVSQIRYAKFSDEPSTVRIVMDLNERQDYEIQEDSKRKALILTLSPKKYVVVIDAGHGGKDPGAQSINNRWEKDFNLSVANKVYKLLENEPSIKPHMTRKDDTFIELSDRASMANELEADVFLSIHGNSYKSSIRGTEVYYYHPESLTFAQMIHKHVLEAIGLPDRGVKTAAFKVIKETEMPAVLLESGYLSNAEDEPILFDDQVQDKLAASIVAAIKEYLQISEE